MRRLWKSVKRLRHMTGVPLLARGLIFVAGWGSLLLALPQPLLVGETVLAGGVLAVLAAAFPAGAAVTVLLVATVAAAALDMFGYGAQPSPVALGTLAVTIYLVHSSAALAAVIPYDAIVDRGVLSRWMARTSLVLLASALLMLLIRYVVAEVSAPAGPVAVVLSGLTAVLVLVYLLFRLARGRS